MKSWDDAQLDCQDLSQAYDSDSLTFFKRWMNTGYKVVLATLGRELTQRTQTASTVASQQYYQCPQDFVWMKSITVTVGSRVYPVTEEPSQDMWNRYNEITRTSNVPSFYFVRQRLGYQGDEFGIYPVPSSASNTITMVYEATERDLAQNKYTTGTISLTNNSATVTGVGTTFSANMVGRYLNITDATGDGLWYRIASYGSATSLTLENTYQGSNVSAANYQIAEAFGLPDELQPLPVYFALAHFYYLKKDTQSVNDFTQRFEAGLALARSRHGNKSRSITTTTRKNQAGGAVYPGWFPLTIS